ncbi:hypothetical protein [Streptomyces cinnamoneus]|uniref:hypothetical protein n=1 Tax=Streptomyces cinnamoneus TaxID=53446 RepID=UPI0011B0A112|nr:hypothetical protein [Streptomyces cinnamoneus]
MDTPLLLLLGAAGGSLRGLVDLHHQVMAWQEARRQYRQAPAGEQGEPPRLRDFYDLIPACAALVVHMGLGAGAAALAGLSEQINGVYAAIAVGMSAPTILTHLGQARTISDAVLGTGPEGPAAPRPGSPGGPEGAAGGTAR